MKRREKIALAIGVTVLAILVIITLFLVINYAPSEPDPEDISMPLSTCAVDDTKIIYDKIGTKYFVYLWDDINMQCMQYSVPDAATFAALEEMIGYGIEIKNYGKDYCFWGDTCLSNGKLIPNYFSKSKTETST